MAKNIFEANFIVRFIDYDRRFVHNTLIIFWLILLSLIIHVNKAIRAYVIVRMRRNDGSRVKG